MPLPQCYIHVRNIINGVASHTNSHNAKFVEVWMTTAMDGGNKRFWNYKELYELQILSRQNEDDRRQGRHVARKCNISDHVSRLGVLILHYKQLDVFRHLRAVIAATTHRNRYGIPLMHHFSETQLHWSLFCRTKSRLMEHNSTVPAASAHCKTHSTRNRWTGMQLPSFDNIIITYTLSVTYGRKISKSKAALRKKLRLNFISWIVCT